MKMPFTEYLQKCINQLMVMSDTGLLQGLGKILDPVMKKFVRTRLRTETLNLPLRQTGSSLIMSIEGETKLNLWPLLIFSLFPLPLRQIIT